MEEADDAGRWDAGLREVALDCVGQAVRSLTEKLGPTNGKPPAPAPAPPPPPAPSSHCPAAPLGPSDGLIDYLVRLLVLSRRCPFGDVRDKCGAILQTVQKATKMFCQKSWTFKNGVATHHGNCPHPTHPEFQHLQYLPFLALDSGGWLQQPKSRVRLLFELEQRGLCNESNFRSLLQLLQVLTRHDLLPYVGQKWGTAVAIELEEEEQDSGSGDMGGGGDQFLPKDFSEACERYHSEGLWSLTGQGLIRECLELEGRLSGLEDENNRLGCRLEGRKMALTDEVVVNWVKELEREIERLGAKGLGLLMDELYKREERLSESVG